MESPDVLTTQVDGDTLILSVHGSVRSLADDRSLAAVDGILKTLQDCGVSRVIVDFGQSPYFGSLMLETLRRIWNELDRCGGKMILCNVSPVGLEVLQIAKFDHLWPVVATKTEAEQLLQSPAC